MTTLSLQKIRFQNGQWEGIIHGTTEEKPAVQVRFQNHPLDTVVVERIENDDNIQWNLRFDVPHSALQDGVHCFLIHDMKADLTLGHFNLLADEHVTDDLRTEIELLRAELDMLKQMFRRHCREG